jgi:hypothetical protein
MNWKKDDQLNLKKLNKIRKTEPKREAEPD